MNYGNGNFLSERMAHPVGFNYILGAVLGILAVIRVNIGDKSCYFPFDTPGICRMARVSVMTNVRNAHITLAPLLKVAY